MSELAFIDKLVKNRKQDGKVKSSRCKAHKSERMRRTYRCAAVTEDAAQRRRWTFDEAVFISIIIPCFNEQDYIGKCLDSVIANDYPKDRLEILVIDGMSKDKTRAVLERYTKTYSFIRLLDNHKQITPAALNIGIRAARGEIIVRMDAHSAYEKDYVSKCVKYLREYNADNVGGVWITVPRNDSLLARAIVFSLSHSFGVGNAHYRTGLTKEPRWVDTVPYGCFRKDIFDRIGLFDETCHRNEDTEFNARLRQAGGKILLVPKIVINYYARSSFYAFCKHIFDNGLRIISHFKLGRSIFSWRHLTPLAFVMSLIGLLGLWGFSSLSGSPSLWGALSLWCFLLILASYTLCNLWFATRIALKEKDLDYFFIMPLVFTSLHMSYGLGSIWGLLRLIGARGLDR